MTRSFTYMALISLVDINPCSYSSAYTAAIAVPGYALDEHQHQCHFDRLVNTLQ